MCLSLNLQNPHKPRQAIPVTRSEDRRIPGSSWAGYPCEDSSEQQVTGRDLCPWSGWFSASLMLSQVPRDWIGTEVVFHSPEVLSSHGESSGDLGGVCRLQDQGDLVLVPTRRDL